MTMLLLRSFGSVTISDESFQQQKLLVVSSSTLQTPAATERRGQKRYVVQEAANIVQKQL